MERHILVRNVMERHILVRNVMEFHGLVRNVVVWDVLVRNLMVRHVVVWDVLVGRYLVRPELGVAGLPANATTEHAGVTDPVAAPHNAPASVRRWRQCPASS